MSDPLPASAPGDGDTVAVERDDAQHRFTVTGDAGVAELVYRLRPGEIEFLHTGVPVPMRGHGIAEALVREGLAYAQREGRTVIATCPFVAAFIRRHPEYRPLLAAR